MHSLGSSSKQAFLVEFVTVLGVAIVRLRRLDLEGSRGLVNQLTHEALLAERKIQGFPTENQEIPFSFNLLYISNENVLLKMFDFSIILLEEIYMFTVKMFIINLVV